MLRSILLGTTILRDVPDTGAGAGAAAPVVVDPAAGAAAAAPAPAQNPAGEGAAAPPAAVVEPVVAAEPAKVEPVVVAEPAKADAHAEPTLLEAALEVKDPAAKAAEEPVKPPVDPKAAEPAKPAGEAKPDEAAVAAAAAAAAAAPVALTADLFKFPDGIKVDQESLGKVTEKFVGLGLKQDQAQELLDLHSGEMQRYSQHVANEQQRIWSDTRKDWRDQVMSDETLGGAGHQTAMQAVARARDLFVKADDMAEFNKFLRVTGAGDHPQFLRLMHNVARWSDEPSAAAQQGNPTPSNGRAPGRSGMRALYKSREN